MIRTFDEVYNQSFEKNMDDRIKEIEYCLTLKSVRMAYSFFKSYSHQILLFNTSFKAIYIGTGVVVAYIKYNKLIAFQYGFYKPNNIPSNCQEIRGWICDYTIYLKNFVQDKHLDRKNLIQEMLMNEH